MVRKRHHHRYVDWLDFFFPRIRWIFAFSLLRLLAPSSVSVVCWSAADWLLWWLLILPTATKILCRMTAAARHSLSSLRSLGLPRSRTDYWVRGIYYGLVLLPLRTDRPTVSDPFTILYMHGGAWCRSSSSLRLCRVVRCDRAKYQTGCLVYRLPLDLTRDLRTTVSEIPRKGDSPPKYNILLSVRHCWLLMFEHCVTRRKNSESIVNWG